MIKKISSFFKSVWLYFPGILTVILLYFMLIKLDPGIDLLIQSGESWLHFTWTCVAILLWSILAWYSARLVSYAKQNKDPEEIGNLFHKHLPRLIAWNCFVGVQIAIILQVFIDSFTAHPTLQFALIITFVIAHNLLYGLLVADWERCPKKWIWIVYTFSLAYFIFWVWNAIKFESLPSYIDYRYTLCIMAALLFIFQLGALRFFVLRRKSIVNNRDTILPKPEVVKQKETNKFSGLAMNQQQASDEKGHFLRFNIFSAIAAALYLVAIFSLPFARNMASLALFMISLAVLSGIASIITCFSIRLQFNLNVVILLVAVAVGWLNDPYKVHLQKSTEQNIYSQRPQARTYFERWVNKRKNLIDSSSVFDIYIVLSDGGGARAGDWVCGMLSKIEDSSYAMNHSNSFKDHLLCLAGASGGTVGNCAFYSLLKSNNEKPINNFFAHSNVFFKSDFLSPTLVRLLGPDYFRHIFPLPMDDRARALESAMEQSEDSLISSYFMKPLQDVMDTSGALPFLFINTTSVRNGMPGDVMTTRRPLHSQRIDVLDLVDSAHDKNNGSFLNLSTAAVLSARFPYVSPAGSIMNNYFVDGGYFDNSGAGIVLELMEDLKIAINDSTNILHQYKNKLRFNILHISNSKMGNAAIRIDQPAMHPLTNDLLAPVLTIAGIGSSTTAVGDGILKNYFSTFSKNHPGELINVNLYDSTGKVFPVSWVISQYNFYLMNQKMQDRISTVYPKLNFK